MNERIDRIRLGVGSALLRREQSNIHGRSSGNRHSSLEINETAEYRLRYPFGRGCNDCCAIPVLRGARPLQKDLDAL